MIELQRIELDSLACPNKVAFDEQPSVSGGAGK